MDGLAAASNAMFLASFCITGPDTYICLLPVFLAQGWQEWTPETCCNRCGILRWIWGFPGVREGQWFSRRGDAGSLFHMCHGQARRVLLGMGDLPRFNRNPYNGYINPYYWVDDHPLLYGNNGSWDPGTHANLNPLHRVFADPTEHWLLLFLLSCWPKSYMGPAAFFLCFLHG